MRAITLTQPWATLVALGLKTIETRGWATAYRGELAITAAKKFPSDARQLCPIEPFATALGSEILHTGKVVAVARLEQCFLFNDYTDEEIRRRSIAGKLPRYEADFGDFTAGRHGFRLSNIVPLREPIACKGALGLWIVPPDVEHAIRGQLAEAVA